MNKNPLKKNSNSHSTIHEIIGVLANDEAVTIVGFFLKH